MKLRTAVLVLAGVTVGCSDGGASSDRIVVFAAASLIAPFNAIREELRAIQPNLEIAFHFAGSQQLALQIENGAKADVFAAADHRWTQRLIEQGLLQDPVVFATNRLVVVTAGSASGPLTLADLSTPGHKIVVASEAVPVGHYTRLVLGRLAGHLMDTVGFQEGVLANIVSEEDNVKSVIAKVRLGEADAGFVYRSDLVPDAGLGSIEIPDSLNVTAEYPVGVTTNSLAPHLTDLFVDYVVSAQGRNLLARYGFGPP